MRDFVRESGFTLIELIVSVALSALLMIGLMGVVNSVARANATVAAETATPAEDEWIVNLLRHDLEGATHVRSEPDQLRLSGFASLATDGVMPTQRQVSIVYAVEKVHGTAWLVRRETRVDVPTNRNTHVELVCPHVISFSVTADLSGDDREDVGREHDPSRLRLQLLHQPPEVLAPESVSSKTISHDSETPSDEPILIDRILLRH